MSIDLQQGDVLSYIMKHEDNEHWWLAEYSKGEVGLVPVSYRSDDDRRRYCSGRGM